MWNMHDGMGWWMAWGSVFWVLFFVGLVFVIAWLARAQGGSGDGSSSRDRALDILRERYARGEVDGEEFERMRRQLGN